MIATNASNPAIHLISHVTPNSAHCSDMYPVYDGEPTGLNETRKLVSDQVDYYLSLRSTWEGSSFAFAQFSSSVLLMFISGIILFQI